MEILPAIFLGFVQGATEFLPVSSSGHLFLVEQWLGLTPDISLMIATHVATLGAVLVVFWRQVWELIIGCWSLVIRKNQNKAGTLALKLGVATLITIGVALLIEPWFGDLLDTKVVALTLLITGGLILLAEKFRPANLVTLTWPITIALGIVQGIAVVPGLSRSGLTIAFLILLGIARRQAAEYSFLLSIPTIAAAGLFLYLKEGSGIILDTNLWLACLVAFVTALIMIYGMLKLVKRHWVWFAPYCLLLGAWLLVS